MRRFLFTAALTLAAFVGGAVAADTADTTTKAKSSTTKKGHPRRKTAQRVGTGAAAGAAVGGAVAGPAGAVVGAAGGAGAGAGYDKNQKEKGK